MFLEVILAAFLFRGGPAAAANTNDTPVVPVLFEHFETVFHTVPALLNDPPSNAVVGFAGEPFGYLTFALDHRSQQFRKVLLKNSEAVLLGTKDYLPPDGLGRVVSTRCYVAVLSDRNDIDVAQYLGKSDLKTASGSPVWSWSVDLGEFGDRETHLSSLFATQVGNTYFVVSNNLGELKSVSEAVASTRSDGTVARIREWDSVKGHEFWGYRKYTDSKSRPPATLFNGMKGVQPEAEALILYVDSEHKTGVLRFLSSDPDDTTVNNFKEMWKISPAKSLGNGVWEIRFPLTLTGPFADSSFQVLWLFGLGVAA